MQRLTRTQLVLLVLLTLSWGLSYPVMKVGVGQYPAITFRALSLWLGLPILVLAMAVMRAPFRIPLRHARELAVLAVTNLLVWHTCIVLAVRELSGGRAAILGYTMPVFAAILGALVFRTPLGWRQFAGVCAGVLGVGLLLARELHTLGGKPFGVAMALTAACTFALGTHLLRRTSIVAPTITISFWLTVITGLGLAALAAVTEADKWTVPNATVSWAIAYQAVLVFGFANTAWFVLARGLPAMASTLSIVAIPVVGVLGGAVFLREQVTWADWLALALLGSAIASVLLPQRCDRDDNAQRQSTSHSSTRDTSARGDAEACTSQ
jgi:drug/metabolite transporter (DMT)-like permease